MRLLICISLALCLAGQDNAVADRELVRVALGRMLVRSLQRDVFLFQRRYEKRELTSEGQLKSQTILTMRRDPWEEQTVNRIIARDDKPLPPDELLRQEEKLRRLVEETRRNPPKTKVDENSWMAELPDALDFHKIGVKFRHNRPADVYEFKPHPGYKSKQMRARAFEKISGHVWIDQKDGEMTKLDVYVFDTINIGFGMLGRVEKGTIFEIERKKWDAGVWFEEWQRVRFELRVMMVKTIRQELETRWSNLSLHSTVKPSHPGL